MQKNLFICFLYMIMMNITHAQTGKIILVSGIQGSGKSTICKHLQEISDDIYIYLPIDAYVELLPKKLQISILQPSIQNLRG